MVASSVAAGKIDGRLVNGRPVQRNVGETIPTGTNANIGVGIYLTMM